MSDDKDVISIVSPKKLNPTTKYRKSVLQVIRLVARKEGTIVSIPEKATKILIKNVSKTLLKIYFNDDDIMKNNYWSLQPNEVVSLIVTEFITIMVASDEDSVFEAIIM